MRRLGRFAATLLAVWAAVPLWAAETRLTDGTPPSLAPVWSHDGKRIFFCRSLEQRSALYVMDADGKNIRPLGSPSLDVGTFSPSPDGKFLALDGREVGAKEEDPWKLALLPLGEDGGEELRFLREGPTDSINPCWSPDGKKIAFLAGPEERRHLWVMNADGSEPRRISGKDISSGPLSWTPDGRSLVLGHGEEDLWIVEVATGLITVAARSSKGFMDVVLSPDGASFVFAEPFISRKGMNLRLMHLPRDGTEATPILAPGRTGEMPAWSPDGGRIAFVRSETGEDGSIYVLSLAGSAAADPGRLPKEGKVDAATAFHILHWAEETAAARSVRSSARSNDPLYALYRCSPDGTTWEDVGACIIRVARSRDHRWQACLTQPPDAPAGGTKLTLRDSAEKAAAEFDHVKAFAFSEDSRMLAVMTAESDGGNLTLVLHDLQDGESASRPLGAELRGYCVLDLAFSATGENLFLLLEDRRLLLIPTGEGPKKELSGDVTSAAWSPEGRSIYATVVGAESGRLVRLSLDGSQSVLRETNSSGMEDLRVLDEKTLFFTQFTVPEREFESASRRPDQPIPLRGCAMLFDIRKKEVIREYPGCYFAVAVSPRGDAFVGLRFEPSDAVSPDVEFYGTIVLTDMESGREMIVVEREPMGGQLALAGFTRGISRAGLRAVTWK